MRIRFLALTLLTTIPACAGNPERTPEQWQTELLQADRAFSEAIGSEGLTLWSSFFTADGSMIQEGVGEIRGTAAVQAVMDAAAGAVTSFSWTPDRAAVSDGGDMGYTVGSFRTTVMGPDAVELESTGMYVSIWRRQADGRWKVEMDLGNPMTGPTPTPSPDAGSGG